MRKEKEAKLGALRSGYFFCKKEVQSVPRSVPAGSVPGSVPKRSFSCKLDKLVHQLIFRINWS